MPPTRSSNPFGPLADPLVATLLAALWFALLRQFQLLPQWDIEATRQFFDAAICAATAKRRFCDGFPLADVRIFSMIREYLQPLPVILAVILLVVLIAEMWIGRRWRNPGVRLKSVLITTMIVGPGLIVNGILKTHWGRPRPWMTEDFGGWLPFVKAGIYSDYCTGNCSFVSGEGAAAGWLMCLAIVLAVHRYRWSALFVGAVSILMAGLRITFGAHYLSDVVLGYLMTVTIFAALAAFAEWSVSRRGANA